ncbi:MAG: hypothetical protein ACRDV8_13905, partial [Acidimicrobiales bacterium]
HPRTLRVTGGGVVARRATGEERPALARLVAERWVSTQTVSRGVVHDAASAEAFIALRGGEMVGCATFVVSGDEAELLTLDALCEGAGGALVGAVAAAAVRRRAPGASSCRRPTTTCARSASTRLPSRRARSRCRRSCSSSQALDPDPAQLGDPDP